MSIQAIITMVVVIGVVWGGLAFFIIKAVKKERMKRANGEK